MHPSKIFVGGLSFETTDEKLKQYFSNFGPVNDAVVMRDPNSKRSRGFGFCTFSNLVAAEAVMSEVEHIIDNRKVEAKWAVPRDTSGKDISSSTMTSSMSSSRYNVDGRERGDSGALNFSKKLFVGGLHYETGDESLFRYFEQFGRIESAQVMFNRETDKSRGFGFVTFEDLSSVHNVMKFKVHTIDGKTVEVKRAVPKNDSIGIVSNTSGRTERASSFNSGMPVPSRPYASSSGGMTVMDDRVRARAATTLGVSSADSFRDSSIDDPFGGYSRSSGDSTFLQIASFGKTGKPNMGSVPSHHAPDTSYASVISRAGGVWATNNRNNKVFSAEGAMSSAAVALKPSSVDSNEHDNNFIYNSEGVSFESSVRDLSSTSPILDSSAPIPSFHTMSPMQTPGSLDGTSPILTSPLLSSNLATNTLDLNPVLENPGSNENIFNVNSFANPGYSFPAFGEMPSVVYGGGFNRDHTSMPDGTYGLGHPTNMSMYSGGHAAPFYSNARFENFTPLHRGSGGEAPPPNGGRVPFMASNELGGSLHSLRPASDASALANSFEGLNISGSTRGNNLWASAAMPSDPRRESGGPPVGSSSTSKPAGAKSNAWF